MESTRQHEALQKRLASPTLPHEAPVGNGMTAQTHFLTNFPTFLGQRILSEVLEEEGARAICLVTPEQEERATRKIAALGGDSSRVELMVGEAASLHLGLSSNEYRHLRREANVIHHLPLVDQKTGKHRLDETLQVTDNLLELASETENLERFSHYSSVQVATRRGMWRSKADALAAIEGKIRDLMRQIPTTIFRPSQMIGDSRTGEVLGPHLPLEFAIRFGLPPFRIPLPPPGFGALPFHVVPADWVAAAAVRLLHEASTIGKTVHLVDPNPMPLRWVWEQVALRMGRRALLPFPSFKRLLKSDRHWEPPLQEGSIDALEHLDEGEGCPPLHSYLDRMLTWAEEQVRRGIAAREHLEDPYE